MMALDFSNYEQLLQKTDDKFDEIYQRNKDQFQCQSGCHECCQPEISVFFVEKEYLRSFIEANPGTKERLEQLARDNPWQGQHCQFLNSEGQCELYSARPIICRSHGAPIRFKDEDNEEVERIDVCPLNFSEFDLATLSQENSYNLSTLNALLTVVNHHFSPKTVSERYPLRLTDILALPAK
jgi:Fe-S-cluster containining protein